MGSGGPSIHLMHELLWDREASPAGERSRVSCASLADVFDAEVKDEWRARLFDLVAANAITRLVASHQATAADQETASGHWSLECDALRQRLDRILRGQPTQFRNSLASYEGNSGGGSVLQL
jgi:hypothetical protein